MPHCLVLVSIRASLPSSCVTLVASRRPVFDYTSMNCCFNPVYAQCGGRAVFAACFKYCSYGTGTDLVLVCLFKRVFKVEMMMQWQSLSQEGGITNSYVIDLPEQLINCLHSWKSIFQI